MRNFWEDLPRPFFVLAPLANVTDAAFRRIIAKYSKPHGPQAIWTEFVSADGLLRATPEGKAKLMRDLVFSEAERPIVAQFFTSDPEAMEHAARLALELGFDGIDINMGCPDRSVEAQGAGAKLILRPELAVALVATAKRGFEWQGSHQVSAKVKWPDWRPPVEMRKRRPELPAYMAGGPNNPLGARAIYLGSSIYRIHGTNEPSSIGKAASSGCIRMLNEDVSELYMHVKIGARVTVL